MFFEVDVVFDHLYPFLFEQVLLNVNTAENEGVSEIAPKIGDTFDPQTMQAIETVYDENAEPNKVIKVNVKGYKLHERLIRPSIVVVSTNKKDEPKQENESPKLDA